MTPPPEPPKNPAGGVGGPPDWNARREALERKLAVTFDRDIEPHEIEFYERFDDAGQVFTPILRSQWRPTNDFVWRNLGGSPTEVKTLLTANVTANNIAKRIAPYVIKAKRQGVAKDQFIIDLRDYAVTAQLVADLGEYNARNRNARIRRLFVFAQGALTEVLLE